MLIKTEIEILGCSSSVQSLDRVDRRGDMRDTRIQGNLFASDIEMYIGICLYDVPFTRKQYITDTILVKI